MARPKKVKLAPTRARLKWVFDKYGKTDPLVPYYVHALWRKGAIGMGFAEFNHPPSLVEALTFLVENYIPGLLSRGRLPAAVDAGRLPAAGYTDPVLPPPAEDATVGEVFDWILHWLYADIMINRSFAARTDCAKLVPALARWVNEEVQFPERPPGGLSAEAMLGTPAEQLDQVWDRPAFITDPAEKASRAPMSAAAYVDTGRAHLFWSPAIGGQPKGHHAIARWGDHFQYICDWYSGARPDLGQFRTFAQAYQAAQEWHNRLPVDASGQPVEQGKVVYRWPDGWTVQALTTWKQFRQEGEVLGHCIGDSRGYYDAAQAGSDRFFSLRNEHGRPWITFHVRAPMINTPSYYGPDPEGKVAHVLQIKGCKNRTPGVKAPTRDCPDPLPDEATRVWDFLAATPWLVGADYQSAWVLTVRRLGYGLEDQPVKDWPAAELVRPPAVEPIKPGELAGDIVPVWWDTASRVPHWAR